MDDWSKHWSQWIGVAVFTFTTMFTGMELAGFWQFLPDLDMATGLILAIFGGAIGGAFTVKYHAAGFAGGMVAGPGSLLALYFYGIHNEVMTKSEVMFVMLLGSLPGVGVYFLCRWFLVGSLTGEPEPPAGALEASGGSDWETADACVPRSARN